MYLYIIRYYLLYVKYKTKFFAGLTGKSKFGFCLPKSKRHIDNRTEFLYNDTK